MDLKPSISNTGRNEIINLNSDEFVDEIKIRAMISISNSQDTFSKEDFQTRRRQRIIRNKGDLIQSNNKFWHNTSRGVKNGVVNDNIVENLSVTFKCYSDDELYEILKDISILNNGKICIKTLYHTIRQTMLNSKNRTIVMNEYSMSLDYIATRFILHEVYEPVEYGFIIKIALLEDGKRFDLVKENVILKAAFVIIMTRMRMAYSGSLLKTALNYVKIVIFDKLLPIENKTKEINDVIFDAFQVLRDLGNYILETNNVLYGKSHYNLEKNLIPLAEWQRPSYTKLRSLRDDKICQRYKYLYHGIKDYCEIPIVDYIDYYDMDDNNKYIASLLYIDEWLQNGRRLENRYKESENGRCENKLQESYLAISIIIYGYKDYFDYFYNILGLQYLYEVLRCNSLTLKNIHIIILDLLKIWLNNEDMYDKFNSSELISTVVSPIMEFADVSSIRLRSNKSEYLVMALNHGSFIMNELLDNWSTIYFLFDNDVDDISTTGRRIQEIVNMSIDVHIHFHEGISFINNIVQKILGMDDHKLDFSTWDETYDFFITHLQPDKFDASLGNAFVVSDGENLKLLKDIETGKQDEIGVSKIFFYYRFSTFLRNGMLKWIISTSIVNCDNPETFKSLLLLFKCFEIQAKIFPNQHTLDLESIQKIIDIHVKDIIKTSSFENENYRYTFSRSIRHNVSVLSRRLNELLEIYRPSLLYNNTLYNLKHFVCMGRKAMRIYCVEEDTLKFTNIERILLESNQSIRKISYGDSKKNIDNIEMHPIINYLEYAYNKGIFRNYLAENPMLRHKLIEWLQLSMPDREYFLSTYQVKNKIPLEEHSRKKENIIKLFKMAISYSKIYPDFKDFFIAYLKYFIDDFEINNHVSSPLTINNLIYQQGHIYFGLLSYIFETEDEKLYELIKKLMLKFLKLIREDSTGVITQLIIAILNYEGPHSKLAFTIIETTIIYNRKKMGLWCLDFLNLLLNITDDEFIIEKIFQVLSNVILELSTNCALRLLEIVVFHRKKIKDTNQLINIHHINNVENLDFYNLFAKYLPYSCEYYFVAHLDEAKNDLKDFIEVHFSKLYCYVKNVINNELDSRYKKNSKGKFERAHYAKRVNKSSTIPSTIIDMFTSHEIGTQFIIQHDIFSKFYKYIEGECIYTEDNIIESSIIFIGIYMKNISESDHVKYKDSGINDYKNAIETLTNIWKSSKLIHLKGLALYALNLIPNCLNFENSKEMFINTISFCEMNEYDEIKNDSGYMETTDISSINSLGKRRNVKLNNFLNLSNYCATESTLIHLILPLNNSI
uniref:HECT domain-containing protein n=1 Tax=Strongyloides venezuelensis TaxID=75913 RepID=A0A0K0G515_STRVS